MSFQVAEAKGLRSNATNFLAFKPLTYVPIQKSLIDKSLLTGEEVYDIAYENCFL